MVGVFVLLNSILDFYLFVLPRIAIDKIDVSAILLFSCLFCSLIGHQFHLFNSWSFFNFHSPFLALFDFSKLFLSPLIMFLVSKFIIVMIS